MKKTENELTAHEAMLQIRRKRQKFVRKVVRKTGRPAAYHGGKMYFLDGQMERVRFVPNLPKPSKEAVGWKRQLPKQAVKTIARETKREMAALPAPAPPVPEPARAAEPQPVAEQPLTFTMERKLKALRELAAMGVRAESRRALLETRQLFSEA